MDGLIVVSLDGWIGWLMDRSLDGWKYGLDWLIDWWIDGRKDRWIDWWMDRILSLVSSPPRMAQRFPCCCSTLGTWHWWRSAPCPWACFLAFRVLVCCWPRLPSPSDHGHCVPALLVCAGFLVTLARVCSPLFLHPASCPHGHLSWLSALITPPVACPRSQSSSPPFPSSQALCHGLWPTWRPCQHSLWQLPPLCLSSLGSCALGPWPFLHRPSLSSPAGAFLLPLLPWHGRLPHASPLHMSFPPQCPNCLGTFLRHLSARRSHACTARLGVQPSWRVEFAADNLGPHSLCWARLRTTPTTFLVMPPSSRTRSTPSCYSLCSGTFPLPLILGIFLAPLYPAAGICLSTATVSGGSTLLLFCSTRMLLWTRLHKSGVLVLFLRFPIGGITVNLSTQLVVRAHC